MAIQNNINKYRLAIALLCFVGFLISILSFFPGWMSNDSAAQFAEAKYNIYGDWHPPLMAYWWHFLIKIYDGPALMLCQNLIFYWVGFYLLANALSEALGRYSLVFPLLGLFPGIFFPLGQIWKDIACGTSLFLCWAILFTSYFQGRRSNIFEMGVIFILSVYAIGVKPNAIVVTPFMMYAMLSAPHEKLLPIAAKFSLSLIACICILFISLNLVPKDKVNATYPFQYTQTYDLLGISVKTNINQFPGYVNQQMGEDSLNLKKYYWIGGNNPLYYNSPFKIGTTDKKNIDALTAQWKKVVVENPKEYLSHRLDNFFSLLRWGEKLPAAVANPIIVPNSFGLVYAENSFSKLLSNTLKTSPYFYFPWIYILLMLISVLFCHKIVPHKNLFYLIALSNMAFILPHFFIAPASDYRYFYSAILLMTVCVALIFIFLLKRIVVKIWLVRRESYEKSA